MKSALLLLALAAHLCSAADALPDFGPENQGLRLKLEIRAADQKEEHRIKLTLRNVGAEDRTFFTNFVYEGRNTFGDFVQQSTTFETFPKVVAYGYQTGGRFRETAQTSLDLKAGTEWSTEWTVKDRTLDASIESWGLRFPTPGRFDLKAEIVLKEANQKVRLWSNTAPIFIGGETRAPKSCAAQILSYDEKSETLFLHRVGENFGSKVGDRFKLDYGMLGYYDLELTHLEADRATAKILKKEIWRTVPHVQFLANGAWAGLVSEDKKSDP